MYIYKATHVSVFVNAICISSLFSFYSAFLGLSPVIIMKNTPCPFAAIVCEHK